MSLEDLKDQELYITDILHEEAKTQLASIASSVKLIETTGRNTLFNRVMKNAVQIYPNTFDYYSCVPLKIRALSLGIFTLKNQPSIMKKMIQFTENFTKSFVKINPSCRPLILQDHRISCDLLFFLLQILCLTLTEHCQKTFSCVLKQKKRDTYPEICVSHL